MNQDIHLVIDFGTTNSLVAYADSKGAHEPIHIPGQTEGTPVVRSLLYFQEDHEPVFGIEAQRLFVANNYEGRLLRSVKKFLAQESFKGTQIGQKFYRVEDILGAFLKYLKTGAEKVLEKSVDQVVLGRPARFSPSEKGDQLAHDRLLKAAQFAGFKEIDFLQEPLAAAQNYKKQLNGEKLVAVVDLGGGTSDFTIIKLSGKTFKAEDVLAVNGINIAGDVLDGSIMKNLVAPEFGSEVTYKLPMSDNILQMPPLVKDKLLSPPDIAFLKASDIQDFIDSIERSLTDEREQKKLDRLRVLVEDNLGFDLFERIEKSKVDVCVNNQAQFQFDYPELEMKKDYALSQFEDWSKNKVDQIFACFDETFRMAGVSNSDIEEVCITGGTSQVPIFKKRLSQLFAEDVLNTNEHFQSVTRGIAVYAHEKYYA